VSGQLHLPAALPSGQNCRTHWTRDWKDPKPVWTYREEKSVLPLAGIEPRSSSQ